MPIEILQIRLPALLKSRIKEEAYRRRISQNQFAIALLERGLENETDTKHVNEEAVTYGHSASK